MKRHYGWRGWSSETSASWRRFWRSGPQTPQQVADEAATRIAKAEEDAQALGLSRTEVDVDPYDELVLLALPQDDQLVRRDKEQRVKEGQQRRARAKRLARNKHRLG